MTKSEAERTRAIPGEMSGVLDLRTREGREPQGQEGRAIVRSTEEAPSVEALQRPDQGPRERRPRTRNGEGPARVVEASHGPRPRRRGDHVGRSARLGPATSEGAVGGDLRRGHVGCDLPGEVPASGVAW